MSEQAFNGTIKEGFKRRFTIIKEQDLERYCSEEQINQLGNILEEIQLGRELDNKNPFNSYVVINLDEPYLGEIVEIMKRNGDWG